MINGRVGIPVPRESDHEDVHVALSAAGTLWERGEDSEALKWLRRAAGVAADRDADRRAVELAKAAAEVATVVDGRRRRTPPPPAPSVPAPSAPSRPAPPALSRPAPPAPSPPAPPAPSRPQPPPMPPPFAHRAPTPPSRPGIPPPMARMTPVPPSQPFALAPEPPRHREGRPRKPAPAPIAESGERPSPLADGVVPCVPAEPRVSMRRLDFQLDESEEDTFIRPETMLRRALMAIDPSYADRTVYTDGPRELDERAAGACRAPDDEEPESSGRSDTQAETQKRRRRSAPREERPRGSLPALRVAVLPIPEDGDVRLLFLPPGAEPPPGVAVALLVPPTERDAELLAKVYAESDAKL